MPIDWLRMSGAPFDADQPRPLEAGALEASR